MELFAADGHDAGGCERVTGKSGMRPRPLARAWRRGGQPSRNRAGGSLLTTDPDAFREIAAATGYSDEDDLARDHPRKRHSRDPKARSTAFDHVSALRVQTTPPDGLKVVRAFCGTRVCCSMRYRPRLRNRALACVGHPHPASAQSEVLAKTLLERVGKPVEFRPLRQRAPNA